LSNKNWTKTYYEDILTLVLISLVSEYILQFYFYMSNPCCYLETQREKRVALLQKLQICHVTK